MATKTFNLGKVSFFPRGQWASSTSYQKNDLVTNGGNSYVSKIDNNTALLTDTASWSVISDTSQKADHGYSSTPKTLKQVDDSKENLINKQNSLAVDGTNTKYPTVDAVNTGLATKLDTIAVKQIAGTSTTDVMSQKAITDILVTKADHGYSSNPKSLKQVEDLKENSANKQNSLATDGTGTKFPTVDAVNAGLLLKENKQLIADYTYNLNIVFPQIESIDYSTSTITFTAPHGIASVPNFYNHTCVAQINDFTIKTNYKAVPSGLQVYSFFKIVQIVSPTALRFSKEPGGSNYVLPCEEPTFVDFTKWHLQYIPPEKYSFNVLFEPCVAVKVVVMVRAQHGQPHFNIKGDETASENVFDTGTVLGLGNAVIERTYWISGNGLVTVRTSGTGNTIRSAGFGKLTYDTINTWRYENITFFNVLTCTCVFPAFCNGTRFLIYKLA